MGCTSSLNNISTVKPSVPTERPRPEVAYRPQYVGGRLHPLVTEKATSDQRARALGAVRKNDAILIFRILEGMPPVENLGMPGYNFTLIHAAAQFNSFQTLNSLFSWIKANGKYDLNAVMSITDYNGNTPAMFCAENDSAESLCMLLMRRLISRDEMLKIQQKLHKTDYKSSKMCLRLIERFIEQDQPHQQVEDADKDQVRKEIDSMIARITKVDQIISQEVEDVTTRASAGISPDTNIQVNKMLQDLIANDSVFVDHDFPANVDSITTDRSHEDYALYEKAVWQRPHQLFKCQYDKIYLFDKIEPTDIIQGYLGDCYFLCALSAIAEFPSRITRIFINKASNKYGIYGVILYVQGVPTEIIVDDLIPCYGNKTEKPLFSQPHGQELWVLLVEKAWAKLYKSYSAIEAGWMHGAVESLLGCPGVTHIMADRSADEIWEVLSAADNAKFIMGCGTRADVKKEKGLLESHAYTILSVHELGMHRVIKLRNPYGNYEWNGDFSDNSLLWTDEYKRAAGFIKAADDGVFFILIEDFMTMFRSIQICMYHEGWQYTYKMVSSAPNEDEYFRFVISHPCEAYFRIHQSDARHLPRDGRENYPDADVNLTVMYVDMEKDGAYVPIEAGDSTDSKVRSTFSSKTYKVYLKRAGTYFIKTRVAWTSNKKHSFTVSAYAPIRINLIHKSDAA